MTKKSIIIDEKAHTELGKLSESLRMNLGSLVKEMIYYFKKTGIDPKDAANKNPSEMISTLDKRIVSFLKVQERDILKPLRQDVFNYQNSHKEEILKLINSINKLLNQHSERMNEIKKNDTDRNKLIAIELEKNRQAILAICLLLDEKNKSGTIDKLKSIFS
ncbi:BfmA/BtgA family mobilization protein [Flavobacterium yafengii]|uniref:BfmA/BtgA family mobilization protein n=1 Tax=Flavobacterium yafengii TaxID=3041253 RepID=A0AAW6TW91_9FLAO|nr:BfmA/BtgA family mobilization protein [Flavobacterium yafengii]MDI5951272.1 BfmA/BtgA family mobilization protein [Flavobacterium yafengii]